MGSIIKKNIAIERMIFTITLLIPFKCGFIVILSLFIAFFCFSSVPAVEKNTASGAISIREVPEQKARISLTPEELEWLRKNPHLKLATLTNQPPFSMMDADRNHTGILADILSLLSDGHRTENRTQPGGKYRFRYP